MLSSIVNYISSFMYSSPSTAQIDNINNSFERIRRVNVNENVNNNIITREDDLILGDDQLKSLPTGRGGYYKVVQLPNIVTTTGTGVFRMYRHRKTTKLEGENSIDRVYWECAGKDCSSTAISCRRVATGKDFNFQMKGIHSNSCDITKESIAERDIRCSAIENGRKVGVKQSGILRHIQNQLLNHIDEEPVSKVQKITLLEQPYSPNTINNIKFNDLDAIAASEAYDAAVVLANKKMQKFMKYIENNYINVAMIPLWNIYQYINHRCNNEMESFNCLLKKYLPTNTNANFWTFLNGIYYVQGLQDRTVNDINNGITMRPQDKFYRDRDAEIFRLRNEYNNELPVMQYLNGVNALFSSYDNLK